MGKTDFIDVVWQGEFVTKIVILAVPNSKESGFKYIDNIDSGALSLRIVRKKDIDMRTSGFSLLELSVVIGIIVFLSMLAMPSFMRFFAKARRAEAYMQLKSLYMAEKVYFAEHGTYTSDISSAGLGWKPEGQINYTYGFAQGGEGVGSLTGALKSPPSALTGTMAQAQGFVVGAAGDIDGDGISDYLTINQEGIVTIVVDDLA